jgi:hypothetical protein
VAAVAAVDRASAQADHSAAEASEALAAEVLAEEDSVAEAEAGAAEVLAVEGSVEEALAVVFVEAGARRQLAVRARSLGSDHGHEMHGDDR